MPCRLREEEVVTIGVLAEKGESKAEIARTLGITEGTVRYHLRRAAEKAEDGRANKAFKADAAAAIIEEWVRQLGGTSAGINVQDLYEVLCTEYGYEGSYRSVLRYVRAHFERPRVRAYRRVETPPGAQTQTDWGEYQEVDIGDGVQALHAFVMVLSHSRKVAVIWSRREDQVSWLNCHNEAYRRFGGVAAVNRIDNVKTAIATGAGAWGVIHPTYRAYARTMRFHIDACAPRAANAKGKVENKVRLSRLRVDPAGKRFDALEELQAWSDSKLLNWSKRALCPVTGKTVHESWELELPRLGVLPLLPEPFDVVVNRPVHPDAMVWFENRSYAVPFEWVGKQVEVRGCAEKVQIVAAGTILREYPRRTEQRLLIDSSCYEGESTEQVIAPLPLGRMGQRLQEIWEMPVEQRPVDLYEALAEVAR